MKPANTPVPAAGSAPAPAAPTVRSRRRSRTVRVAALAVVPALLAAGCGFGSDGGGSDDAGSASPSAESAAPSPAPVKYEALPNPCQAIGKKTVQEVVPKAKSDKGKNLNSEDLDSYGTCLWTGLDDFDYRSLSISLRRFESDAGLGTGDKRAADFAAKQSASVAADDTNKVTDEQKLPGVGDAATSIAFDSTRKDGDRSEDYREHRVVVTASNVVITVDYAGAGFEDAKKPSAETVRKAAEKVAKEALTSVK